MRLFFVSIFFISAWLHGADEEIQMEEFRHKIFLIKPDCFEIFPIFDEHAYVSSTAKKIVFLPNAGREIDGKKQKIVTLDPLEGFTAIIIDRASTSTFVALRNEAMERKKYIRFDTQFTMLENDKRRISEENFENAFRIDYHHELPEFNYHDHFIDDFIPSCCDETLCFFLCCFSCKPQHELIIFNGSEIKNYENASWWQFFNHIHQYPRHQKVRVLATYNRYPDFVQTLHAKHVFVTNKPATEMMPLIE